MTETETVIADYLVTNEGAPADLTIDTHLIEEEILDSFGIFTLIDYIDERFDAQIPEEEITLENFGSIAAIARAVDRATSR